MLAGVGYRVTVTPATAAALVTTGPKVEQTLFVHTHVREDAIVLYGFAHDDERRCFEVLLGSHGVGPALALSIMALLSPAALSTAVLEDDIETLCTVPGVGRKTAARLLIELKSRLDLPDLSFDPTGVAANGSDASRSEFPHGTLGGPGRIERARATPPTKSVARSTACATMSGWKRCSAWPCASWPAGEPTGAAGGPGHRRRGRPRASRRATWSDGASSIRPRRTPKRSSKRSACAHARSRSSSARPSWSSISGSCCRPPASVARRWTTSFSPGRPAWARPRWPASWPPRWRPGCASPSGPVLTRAGDLAALLTDLQDGDVLFIDEIHRLHRSVEEMLYSAMEDGRLDILIGKGPTARSIRLELPKFTLRRRDHEDRSRVGATA